MAWVTLGAPVALLLFAIVTLRDALVVLRYARALNLYTTALVDRRPDEPLPPIPPEPRTWLPLARR